MKGENPAIFVIVRSLRRSANTPRHRRRLGSSSCPEIRSSNRWRCPLEGTLLHGSEGHIIWQWETLLKCVRGRRTTLWAIIAPQIYAWILSLPRFRSTYPHLLNLIPLSGSRAIAKPPDEMTASSKKLTSHLENN